MANRPSFIECYLDDLKDTYRLQGVWGLLPIFFLVTCAASSAASYFVPVEFFTDSNWEVSATVYTGLLAFNALTLALAWAAIGRVYENLTRDDFASFLKKSGVLSKYLFYIAYIHVTQSIAAFVTLVALVTIFLPLPVIVDRIVLAVILTATLFALRWALGAVTVVQDLSWQYASFDELEPQDKQQLRLAVDNHHNP